jgi:quercetin dioxygenase-like cupin family protein
MEHPMMKLIAATVMVSLLGLSSTNAGGGVVVTPVARATTTIGGQPIVLPQEHPEVTVSIYEVPPGSTLPQSADPGMRYDYLLSGRLRLADPGTGVVSDLSEGQFFVAPTGAWNSAVNPGDTNTKILVIRQASVDNTGRRWLRTANGYFQMPARN